MALSVHAQKSLDKRGHLNGGGRGIRTPVSFSAKTVFKAACFNRSHMPACLIHCTEISMKIMRGRMEVVVRKLSEMSGFDMDHIVLILENSLGHQEF